MVTKAMIESNIEEVMSEGMESTTSRYRVPQMTVNTGIECFKYLMSMTEYEYIEFCEEIVEFVEMDFTYIYLLSIQDALADKMTDLGIFKTELIESRNCVDIYIGEDSLLIKDEIIAFLSVAIDNFEYGSINFVVTNDLIRPSAKYALAGTEVFYTTTSGNYGGTIGFNATYGGKKGIETNGHVAPSGKTMKCTSGTIGTPTISYIGDKLDVAFIPFSNQNDWNTTYRLQNISYGEYIYRIAASSEMIAGGSIKRYGISTGITKGSIRSTSVTLNVNYGDTNKTIRDVFSYTPASERGDSGGPVGRQSPKEVYRLLGIHFAGDGTYGYGIKYSNIAAKYSISAVTYE